MLELERLDDSCYPKESFLVTLIRNAIMSGSVELYSRYGLLVFRSCPSVIDVTIYTYSEDVMVCLPRHISGGVNPLGKFVTNGVRAPLIMSFCESMPCDHGHDRVGSESSTESDTQRSYSNGDDESGESGFDEDEESSRESSSILRPALSINAFLTRPRPIDDEDDESEDDESVTFPPEFEAHFSVYPQSSMPPSTCDIPVLLMAEDKDIGVLMSSLLYQRRVWHIDEPLIGVGFAKYDSVIRLYVGWLDEEVQSGYVLVSIQISPARRGHS